MSAKIFVRERRKVEKGEKKPRFRVIGYSGTDLRLRVKHLRMQEAKEIAEIVGAEVVVLEASTGKKLHK